MRPRAAAQNPEIHMKHANKKGKTLFLFPCYCTSLETVARKKFFQLHVFICLDQQIIWLKSEAMKQKMKMCLNKRNQKVKWVPTGNKEIIIKLVYLRRRWKDIGGRVMLKQARMGWEGHHLGATKTDWWAAMSKLYFLTQEHRRNYAIVPTCTTEVEGRSSGEKTIIQTYTNITM